MESERPRSTTADRIDKMFPRQESDEGRRQLRRCADGWRTKSGGPCAQRRVGGLCAGRQNSRGAHEGVELATKAHAAVIAQKTFKGETAGVNYIKSLEEKYKDSVRLVPAGNRADEYILLIADQTGNHILSRDRYQDPQYMKRYPWLIIEDQDEIDSRRLHKFAVFDSHVTVPDLCLFEKIDYGD